MGNGAAAQALERLELVDGMEVYSVPLIRIRLHDTPFQYRQAEVDLATQAAFEADIREHGVRQPIKLVPTDDHDTTGEYWIVAGHRRTGASVKAGRETIPAIILDMDDALEVLVESGSSNTGAKVGPVDQAEFAQRLLENGASRKRVMETMNWDPSMFGRRLKLLQTTPWVRDAMRRHGLKITLVETMVDAGIPPDTIEQHVKFLAAKEVNTAKDPVEKGVSNITARKLEILLSRSERMGQSGKGGANDDGEKDDPGVGKKPTRAEEIVGAWNLPAVKDRKRSVGAADPRSQRDRWCDSLLEKADKRFIKDEEVGLPGLWSRGLLPFGHLRVLKKNWILYESESRAKFVYLVLQGCFFLVYDAEDETLILDMVGPGAILGTEPNYAYTVSAVTDCVVLAIPRAEYSKAIASVEKFGRMLLEVLSERLENEAHLRKVLITDDPDDRVKHVLLNLFRRWGVYTEPNKTTSLRKVLAGVDLTHGHLAQLAGCTTREVKRTMRRLTEDGLIKETKKGLEVANEEMLRPPEQGG